MRRLILFDIDGTLLTTGGAAARAFRRALARVFGTSGLVGPYSFAGKTDPQIARELLTAAGMEEAAIDARLPSLWEAYLGELPAELAHASVRLLAGVEPLLARLRQRTGECVVGLLTGNIEGGARLKLAAAGLDFDAFDVGAFGSDHAERRALPAVAVARAERRFGRSFAGKSIVVIGDTPHDIACGESLGVRTIAVASGTYAAAELAECNPDHLFETLQPTTDVCAAIFSE